MSYTKGPWQVGYRGSDVGCTNEKIGGYAKLFDVRGWGYLTGNGHGGLGLDTDTANEIQQSNARLAAAAPELLEALKGALEWMSSVEGHLRDSTTFKANKASYEAAVAKAAGR